MSRSAVEFGGDFVELFLAEAGDAGAFGKY
jgi:hypothetical protein